VREQHAVLSVNRASAPIRPDGAADLDPAEHGTSNQAPVRLNLAELIPSKPAARTKNSPDQPRQVIVVESEDSAVYTDRIDDELSVAARLRLPFTPERLSATLTEHGSRTVLCTYSLDNVDPMFLAICQLHDVEVYVLAHPVYGVLRPMRLRRFGGLPWLRVRQRSTWSRHENVKRAMDLTLTLLAAPFVLPLAVLIMLATSVGGPPLYFQERVGARGEPFRMVKFRTMVVDAERHTGPALSTAGDLRVTRVGRVLRRSRLDELPQLWNVLCGQMSLVGPRPERPEFAARLRHLPHYELRELIRPGITGIAQLTSGYAATSEEKLRCDLLYLHSRSLRSDLSLIVLTVLEMFRGFPRG
jgi:lipopolysaccharide/colanic/teichoic acid biosynthesis glycosyltransferase